MPEVRGFPYMWPIAGGLMLLGLIALARSMHHAREADLGPFQAPPASEEDRT